MAIFLPCFRGRRCGAIQPSCQRPVDDGAFDRLDRHRRFGEVQRTACLAGRGTDAACELREVVGRVEVAAGFFPVVAIDEIVPVRDLIVDRAAAVTKRNAAIHAARRLVAHGVLGERYHELVVIPDAVGGRRGTCGPAGRFPRKPVIFPTTLILLLRPLPARFPAPSAFLSRPGDIPPASPCGI